MIGPSAPNGSPVPIEIAEEIGFRLATFSVSLLSPYRIVSIASGMPWQRILSEPKRHQTDQQASDNRDHHHHRPTDAVSDRNGNARKPSEPGQIGRQRNQMDQCPCRKGTAGSGDERHRSEPQHLFVRAMVRETLLACYHMLGPG